MKIVIDIETIPDQTPGAKQLYIDSVKAPAKFKKAESIAQWLEENKESEGEQQWLKTSFDGAKGQVCAVGVLCVDTGRKDVFTGSERGILMQLSDFCVENAPFDNATTAAYFIGHNAKGFDLPFLHKRFVINNIKPGFKCKWHGRHGVDMYDTMEGWAGFNGRISLDNLANALGLGGKTEGMDGSQVWPEFEKGNIDKIASYCADDVELTYQVYKRLNWLD